MFLGLDLLEDHMLTSRLLLVLVKFISVNSFTFFFSLHTIQDFQSDLQLHTCRYCLSGSLHSDVVVMTTAAMEDPLGISMDFELVEK